MKQPKTHTFWKKTVLALLLTCGLGLLSSPSQASGFLDTQDHWAQDHIQKWTDYGVLAGSQGYFHPDASIIRGDMAVILDALMRYQTTSTQSFYDLGEEYYATAVKKLFAAGIMSGYEGYVRPTDYISREEAALVLANALHISYDIQGETSFADNQEISPWARGAVTALYDQGLLTGRADNTFDPTAKISRAEVATMLSQGVDTLVQVGGTYVLDSDGTVVINVPSVTLSGCEIAGDLILAEGVGAGLINLSNVNIGGNLIVKGGGSNAITLLNVTLGGQVQVDREGYAVRMSLTGNTTIPRIQIMGDCTLVTDSNYTGYTGRVEILEGRNVTIKGTFPVVVNQVDALTLTIGGNVSTLETHGAVLINGTPIAANSLFYQSDIPGIDEVGEDTSGLGQYQVVAMTDTIKLNRESISLAGEEVFTAVVTGDDMPTTLTLDDGTFTWSATSSDGGEVELEEVEGDSRQIKIKGYKKGTVTVKVTWEVDVLLDRTTYTDSKTMEVTVTSDGDVVQPIYYKITLDTAENGSFTTDVAYAKEGDTVTVTLRPDYGYRVTALSYTEASGEKSSAGLVGTIGTFIMPANHVTVTASFGE